MREKTSVVERLARAMYASYELKKPWEKAAPSWHPACRRNARVLLKLAKSYGLQIGFATPQPDKPGE